MKYLRYELLQKYVKGEPRDEYMKGNLIDVKGESDDCFVDTGRIAVRYNSVTPIVVSNNSDLPSGSLTISYYHVIKYGDKYMLGDKLTKSELPLTYMQDLWCGFEDLPSDTSIWQTYTQNPPFYEFADTSSYFTYLGLDSQGYHAWRFSSDSACHVVNGSGTSLHVFNFNIRHAGYGKFDSYSFLFRGCYGLASADLSGWESNPDGTSNYRYMFLDDRNMWYLDATGLVNTTLVNPYVNDMFEGCLRLHKIVGLDTWDMSGANSLYRIFEGCEFLNSLSLEGISSWDVSNVTNMSRAFLGVASAYTGGTTYLDYEKYFPKMMDPTHRSPLYLNILSAWDVSNVTDMSEMFSESFHTNCGALFAWDVSNVTNMKKLFSGDWYIYFTDTRSIDLSAWDVSNVTDMSEMFNCRWASDKDFIGMLSPNTTGFSGRISIRLDCWNISSLRRCNNMYDNTFISTVRMNNWSSMENVDSSWIGTSTAVVYGKTMFAGGRNIGKIYAQGWSDTDYANLRLSRSRAARDSNVGTFVSYTTYRTDSTATVCI